MTSAEQRSIPAPVVGAIGLLGLAIVLLGVGGFVRFDDYSGTGSDRWVVPLGFLAAVLAVAGGAVSCVTAQSRRWFGGALVVLDAFLILQCSVNRGFRFVWVNDESEMVLLQVVLGCVALTLIATGLQSFKRPAPAAGRWLVRAAAYACGAVIATVVAVLAGIRHYETDVCTNDDCDLGGLEGMVWGMVALGVSVVVVLVIELTLWVVRRRRRTTGVAV
jgi:hypothetical protein